VPDILLGALHQHDLDALGQLVNARVRVDHQRRVLWHLARAHLLPQLRHVRAALGSAQDGVRLVLLDLSDEARQVLVHREVHGVRAGNNVRVPQPVDVKAGVLDGLDELRVI